MDRLISEDKVIRAIYAEHDRAGTLRGYLDAIKAIPSAEPCEDAISRDAVLEKAVYTETEEGWCGYTVDVDYIKSLPPVKPQYTDDEIQKMQDLEQAQLQKAYELGKTETGHCKDCKYFEYDSVAKVDGVPLIVAHEICSRWGDGCKTKEDGYCFLFEPQKRSE